MQIHFLNYSAQTWDVKRYQPSIFLTDENEYPFGIPAVEGNRIIAETGARKTAALHLRWKVSAFGEMTLTTGQLEAGDQPYNLNVEIARDRITKIRDKQQEWMQKGFSPSSKYDEQIKKAEEIFDAIDECDAEAVKARWADLSLCWSMPAGEMLALEYADWGLEKRKEENGFKDFLLGCNFYGYPESGENYSKHFGDLFNYATLPFYWSRFEGVKGQCGWEAVDRKIEWLDNHGLEKKGHPLFWAQFIPDWVETSDLEKLKVQIKERILSIVGHYKNNIKYWDVINEIQHLNLDAKLRYTNDQAIELTRFCCDIVKEVDPAAVKIVNCDEPFGEYRAWQHAAGFPPMAYFDELIKKQVDFDVIGIQLYQGAGWTYVRDLFEMSRYFDRYERFGKDVHLTELGVPSREGVDPNDFSSCFGNGMIPWKASDAGFWREPWTQRLQGDWVEGFYRILMAKPFIKGITWWDFADFGEHFYPFSGMLDHDLQPKELYWRLLDLKKKYLA